jgi:mersacidin/lichenicidin family type 2 lantibiotic
MIDVAHALSNDYIKNLVYYGRLSESIKTILSDFQSLTGLDPKWPNTIQRGKIYGEVLGRSFSTISGALRRGAIIFSEDASGKGEEIVRQAFKDEVITLRAYLKNHDEYARVVAEHRTQAIFLNAVTVLRSPELAMMFGLPTAIENDWPFQGSFSSHGSLLIEEITRKLSPKLECNVPTILQERFINLQRVAYYGKLTILGVMDETKDWDNSDKINILVQNAYRWTRALQNLIPDNYIINIRAWKDLVYRRSLTDIEKSMLAEHPSGQVNLTGTELGSPGGGSEQTITIQDKVCCSTGDLDCSTEALLCGTPYSYICTTAWCPWPPPGSTPWGCNIAR